MSLRSRMESSGGRVPFARRRPAATARPGGAWAVWAPRLLSLLMAGLLVQAGNTLWRTARPPAQRVSPPLSKPVAVAVQDVDVGLIAARHLFGMPAQTAGARQAPPSRANLVLGGIWHLTRGEGGYALIGEKGGRQRPYRPGDQLPGGAELVGIHADRVLIRRDGRSETLLLPQGATGDRLLVTPTNP
jgi:general secretion pathway protein C